MDFSFHAPGVFVRTNVNEVHSVLEAMRTAAPGKRLPHASTEEVYGEVLKMFSPESAAIHPRSVYFTIKACGDLLVDTCTKIFDLDVVIVRPCNLSDCASRRKISSRNLSRIYSTENQ